MSNIEQTLSIIKPDVVMKLEKENAIKHNRDLMGSTNPKDAKYRNN